MEKKYLIAYGSMARSTAEVAEAIAEEMRKGGAQVDVQPVEAVNDLQAYDAVIVGSAVRIGSLIAKTRKFLRKNKKQLQKVPVAYFLVCLMMKDETSQAIQTSKRFAKPMLKIQEPVSLGLFGGCLDPEKLTGYAAVPFKNKPCQG